MLALNMNIFWTFFNLIVLYLLMRRFLFGPVNQFMENRAKEISDSLEHAEKVKQEAGELKKSYENILAGAEAEAGEILKTAKRNAVREYDDLLQSAKKEAVQTMRDADKAIALETQKAVRDVQKDIVDIALMAAERAAAQAFDEKACKELVETFVLEAGGEK